MTCARGETYKSCSDVRLLRAQGRPDSRLSLREYPLAVYLDALQPVPCLDSVDDVVRDLELDLGALCEGARGGLLEVLPEVLRREVGEGPAPHSHGCDPRRTLGRRDLVELPHQRADQRLLVHSARTSSATTPTAAETAGVK